MALSIVHTSSKAQQSPLIQNKIQTSNKQTLRQRDSARGSIISSVVEEL